MITEAILLCGGKGTRFLPISNKIPKPLIKVNSKCLIDYQIDLLLKYGIEHIILAAGHKADPLAKHIIKIKSEKLQLILEKEPLGTGGAIKNALKYIEGNRFFVLNCDNIIDINLWKMQKLKGNVVAIAKVIEQSRYGEIVPYGNGIKFLQKPKRLSFVHAGYCIFTRKDADKICPIKGPYEDNLNNILLNPYYHNGYFYPIDSQEDIKNYLLKNRKA